MSSEQLLAIVLATVAQFIVGAMWYTFLFGKIWGKIHGFDKLDKKTQEKMMAQMGPIYGVQALVTLLTSWVLVTLSQVFPKEPLYMLTFWIWLGFVTPAYISANLFGNTPAKWLWQKSAILAGGSLAALMTGAFVVQMMLG